MNGIKLRKMYIILYGVIFLIGLLITYFAVSHFLVSRKIVTLGVRTEAEVIDFVTIKDSEGDTYAPVLEFFDDSKSRIEYQSSISSAQPSLKTGDMIEVIYNPDNHKEVKVVSYWGIYRWNIVLLILGLPFLVIGGGYFLYIFL